MKKAPIPLGRKLPLTWYHPISRLPRPNLPRGEDASGIAGSLPSGSAPQWAVPSGVPDNGGCPSLPCRALHYAAVHRFPLRGRRVPPPAENRASPLLSAPVQSRSLAEPGPACRCGAGSKANSPGPSSAAATIPVFSSPGSLAIDPAAYSSVHRIGRSSVVFPLFPL